MTEGMEKRGVITTHTPGCCRCEGGDCVEPTTKEAADQLQQDTMNDAIDAVAERSQSRVKNQ